MRFGVLRRSAALVCASLVIIASTVPAAAENVQNSGSSIVGTVVDQRNALSVPNADVSLSQNGTVVSSQQTDASGQFAFHNVAAGIYNLTIRANGFFGTTTPDVVVAGENSVSTVNAALTLASGGSETKTIGRTTSTRDALAAATTISQSVNVSNTLKTGQTRVTDQLATLPAVNLATSSSFGDDEFVSIRGFGDTETQALLDGHPIGPQGVNLNPRSNQWRPAFNYGLMPAFGLQNVVATYGSGAQGLYGTDTIAGSINFETLNPTGKPQATFQQQFGGFGLSSSSVAGTGTFGRLGVALAAGVVGSYGAFYPGQMFQAGRPSNLNSLSVNPPGACNNSSGLDVSACNQAVSTYAVSQNTKLGADMLKLHYSLSPSTSLTASVYDAVQWDDNTGNGDNDFLPYDSRLNQILNPNNPASAPNCTTPSGGSGYSVITDPVNNVTGCYTAQQYAAASSGPVGGGAGRQSATQMRDYHVRFNTALGQNNVTLDYFMNNYTYWKDSSLSGGYNAQGQLLGTPDFSNFYNTEGFLASDDLVWTKNELGFGYYVQHQLQTGDISVSDPTTGALILTALAPQALGEGNGFLRDTYTLNDKVSLFANMWMKRSSVTQQTTFDPRISLQIRPTPADVFRVTYGRSDGAPSPLLKSSGALLVTNNGSSLTTVSCNGFNQIGSAGNPNLKPENANDFEAGYGHRFKADSNIQVDAYVTAVKNQLFVGSEPLAQYGLGNVIFAPGTLATYEAHLDGQCGVSLNDQTVIPYLSVGTTYNAASALARGIEISGRQRINRIAYLDYSYSAESSFQTGIPDSILKNNATVTNGSQVLGIPIHQATISLDVAPRSWEFRLDNYYTEFNNPLNRPSYWHSNAFLTKSFDGGRTLLTLGGTNIFGQAVQYYGYIGHGTYAPENQFFSDATAMQEFVNGSYAAEEFGLTPPQVTLTLQERL